MCQEGGVELPAMDDQNQGFRVKRTQFQHDLFLAVHHSQLLLSDAFKWAAFWHVHVPVYT